MISYHELVLEVLKYCEISLLGVQTMFFYQIVMQEVTLSSENALLRMLSGLDNEHCSLE